jgi:hypothetical protein
MTKNARGGEDHSFADEFYSSDGKSGIRSALFLL